TGNYNDKSGSVAIAISKADPTISVLGYTGIYDGDLHGATGTAKGVKAELLSGLDLGDSFANVTGGTADWVFTDATGNYNDKSGSVAIAISKAASLTQVTVVGEPFIYTGLAQTPATVRVTGAGGLNLTPDADFANNTNAGTATASYSYPGDENHFGSDDSKDFTIGKADALITVTPYDVTYDGTAHTSLFSAMGVETPTPVDLASLMTVSGTTHTNASDYTVDPWSFAGNGNYKPTAGTVNNNIRKRPITITAEALSKYIGQVDPPLTYQITPGDLVNGDSFSGSLLRLLGECSRDYDITIGTLENTNYDITYHGASFTIKNVTIDASQSSLPIQLNTPTTTLKATVLNLASELINGVKVSFTIIDGEGNSKDLGVATTNVETVNGQANLPISTFNWQIGLYKIVATVVSDCSVVVTSTAYMTIYDPNGSFITGGGWIKSPVGALTIRDGSASLEGKANFGFNAKYKKGKTTVAEVEGNTEFQFQTGNFNFKSNMLSSGTLVISGAKATFRGLGTVNGTGEYGFMVSAIDGNINGGGVSDKFRIKIWEKGDVNKVVYDNQKADAENVEATTELGGGSIVIHEVKTKAAEIVPDATAKAFKPLLKVYPNPFTDKLNIEFASATDTQATLEIYSITGAKLETLYNGPVNAGQLYSFEYLPRLVSSQMVFYHLTMNGETQVGKMIYNEKQ
ncbi:MAG TPA: MBG domain-containing protein, partial [Prolixibacteraceae bacterium]